MGFNFPAKTIAFPEQVVKAPALLGGGRYVTVHITVRHATGLRHGAVVSDVEGSLPRLQPPSVRQ
ncbi:hypothetical protein D3C77_750740 [compost metagenome]